MSYFYVKNSLGTRTTGGGLTIQSGSFATLGAASVYATITLAITDGAGSGDIICVSDSHYFTTALAINYVAPTTGDFLLVISVADANCDQSATATSVQEEGTSSTNDLNLQGRMKFIGTWLIIGDNIQISTGIPINADNATFETIGAGDVTLGIFNDGASAFLTNSYIKAVSGGNPVSILKAGRLAMIGGSISGGATGITSGGFTSGGGSIEMIGVDLSSLSSVLFAGTGSSPTQDSPISIILKACQLHASATFLNETLENINQRLEVYNSSSSSAAAEYQFYIETYGGKVEDQDDSGIHRDESTAFPSGTKVSAKCLTDANASLGAPFWFELPARYAELSVASTDTLRIYLASTVALDDTDVWVEVSYADGTNKHTQNFISVQNAERMTVASAGTALTTDSGSTWKDGASDLAGYNEYQIDVDTSGDVGADCIPTIKIYVAIPSTTIYFDPVVDMVA